MNYDIFSRTAPAMPKPGKGTEIVKLLLSQVSKGMQEPILPMTLPALAAHVSGAEFKYPDNKYYELCGQMGHLIGPSGVGKDELHDLVEAIMRSFRDHDKAEYRKLEALRLNLGLQRVLFKHNMPLLNNNMPLLLDKDGLLTMQKRGWLFFENNCGNVWRFHGNFVSLQCNSRVKYKRR